MRKILLVIDDFNELVGLETLFRRLGFDVLSIGRESLVAETVLGFPPDLAIATGRGRNVDGLNLAPKLRFGSTQPKLVVLLPNRGDDKLAQDPGLLYAEVDAVIETPFEPRSALKVVSRLLGLPPEPLLEKYSKIVSARLFEPDELKIIKHQEAAVAPIHVTGSGEPDKAARPGADESTALIKPVSAREKRYQKFLEQEMEEELPPMLDVNQMRDARLALEAAEKNRSIEEEQKVAKHNREKREFVRAMIETAQSLTPTEYSTAIETKSDNSKKNGGT
ncbi:MAG: hypothetical protein U1E10_12210 [Bdellovibrionales bacterium]|nr:hypothetical protein [Bdellovibrionales bacterium]